MLLQLLYLMSGILVVPFILITVLIVCLRKWLQYRKAKLVTINGLVNVGIFHPYCNAGGGGERVLWCAVRALQAMYDNIKVTIYTGDIDASPEKILEDVKTVFNINVENENTRFVYLTQRRWVEARKYSHFTLLGQSMGSIILGMEALWKFPPDVFLDTMGYAFTLPLFRFVGSCKVGCYVHYPTISSDMLRKVQQREYSHNNKIYVARNPFLTWLKLAYYRIFAKMYSLAGRCAETILVNSSWTENHIIELWNIPFKTHRVYPPCEINLLRNLPRNTNSDKIIVLSVGQFRPEKDHPLQLQIMYELRTLLIRNETLWNKIRLVIVGSCRNQADYDRLKNIQDLSKHLSLENCVEFKINVCHEELLRLYKLAKIGIHTMWNEHFGIGVVECMAAGIIMIAHRSGGPLLDIIETSEGCQTGYLATDAIEYANYILKIISNSMEDNRTIRNAAMFVGRRGIPEKVYCDNATNFVGASTRLKELYNKAFAAEVTDCALEKGMQLIFIPPRSPHFGGLWEAAVKGAKHLMVRSVGNANLTYEKLLTVLVEVEAVLNSRPIARMSDDPYDGEALTPAHLLIGDSLKAMPAEQINAAKLSSLGRWQALSYLKQRVWSVFQQEYMLHLQARARWSKPQRNLEVGDLVLVHEDNLPPQKWLLGRIVGVTTGNDGKVRVADVKTRGGVYRRAIHKLALIPVA